MSRGKPGASQVHDDGWCHYVSTSERQRSRAVRAVCALARDAADAVFLLDVLGLDPVEGKETAA